MRFACISFLQIITKKVTILRSGEAKKNYCAATPRSTILDYHEAWMALVRVPTSGLGFRYLTFGVRHFRRSAYVIMQWRTWCAWTAIQAIIMRLLCRLPISHMFLYDQSVRKNSSKVWISELCSTQSHRQVVVFLRRVPIKLTVPRGLNLYDCLWGLYIW